MSSLTEHIVAKLSPYVGDTVADTCVRATAISLGKSAEELSVEDLPTLESNVRKLLGAIAPTVVIDQVLLDIERGSL